MMSLRSGDFTGLAEDYSKFRPTYSEGILSCLLALLDVPTHMSTLADVGAGTGIWTRLMASRQPKRIVAIEPNDQMRAAGIRDSAELCIEWRAGTGEETGLEAGGFDLVTMASSFHWVDFERGLAEFRRIVRPGGRFAALWNPRLIEANPLLLEIESEIGRLAPGIKRVSSGRSGLADRLTELLANRTDFDDLIYLEGRHVNRQTPAEYLGAWRSVNDVRVQLGPERFTAFLAFVEQRIAGLSFIETTYLTRAWAVRRI